MLRDDINNAVKDAMRAKDERKLSTLRMVNSTIKNADIAARGEGKPPLADADLLAVFQKMIKQRQESVELYEKGGRAELAAQEREEIAIIQAYLPKQMSDDDVKAAISAFLMVELTIRKVESLRSSLARIASLTALLMSSRSIVFVLFAASRPLLILI